MPILLEEQESCGKKCDILLLYTSIP